MTRERSPLLDEAGAASYLKISRKTMEGWRLRGGGPPYVRISHRCVRYRPEDLDAWLEARIFNHTAEETSSVGARGD
jgi:predicted DNA-binding transcriptional regulator AlpA